MRRTIFLCAAFLVITGAAPALLTGAAYAAETPYGLAWTRQLGTSSDDYSHSVAIDGSGNAYISGWTEGSLGGPNAGLFDAFLAKYDTSGSLLWTRQLGTSSSDFSESVAIDGSGNAYISGVTEGNLGGTNAGNWDAFLAKYDTDGVEQWKRQLGTISTDHSYSVAIDGSGNAYISGYTYGNLGGPNAGGDDAFLAKYDSAGSLLWTRQLGTSAYDYSRSVAIDGSGNAYISGYTYGDLGGPNAGFDDAFLAKYDSAGSLLWTRQLGTSAYDYSLSVAIDGLGNAYISGYTKGDLGGPNEGWEDAFLAKYDSAGSLLWTRQLGTSSTDKNCSVAIDGSGKAYISGYTYGDLGGPNAGNADAFLAKFVPDVRQISTDTVDTSFDPNGGAFGLGTLLFEQDTPIEIDYDNGLTEVFEDGSIQIWTDLFDDTSSGDLASGYFKGGEFAIFDDDDNILLSGNVDWFLMGEVFDDMGFMSGTGHLVVTGGDLMDNFGTLADVFDVTFRLDPMDIDDFNTAFTGESDLTIIPVVVPEPSTIFLMIGSASGLAVIAGIMRRKTR
ncbi:MAG: SBBP repeat-containing protein [Planctomycetota bacterium]